MSHVLSIHQLTSQLYKTDLSDDPGAEEMFPNPDNHFKMRRSVENAETVGMCPCLL